jgi:glycosyltransferase involved in cell wall biosynthesis
MNKSNSVRVAFYDIVNTITFAGTLGGGERIIIECLKRWPFAIYVLTSEQGRDMYERYLHERLVKYSIVDRYARLALLASRSFLLSFILVVIRTMKGCLMSLRLSPDTTQESRSIIYSSSIFLADILPGLILSRRLKGSRWVVGFYLFAPRLFEGFNPVSKRTKLFTLRDLVYFVNELPVLWLVRTFADMILVTNDLDRVRFERAGVAGDRVMTVHGGVDLELTKSVPSPSEKIFDAVYVGRFHPQKGVLELVDIWQQVCAIRGQSKLVMIGNGPLEEAVRRKIRAFGLQNNIKLTGFMDGIEKTRIFKASKIVLHPAVYDSGGMAACEAMACGLPGISFDLPALRTYYPKGMLKVACFDLKAFASEILNLLDDPVTYKKLSLEASAYAATWDWDLKATELLERISSLPD